LIVDGRMARRHQTLFIELPILIAVRSVPVSRIVMTFISEANGDPVVLKRPKFLDQSVVAFTRPFASKRGDSLAAADDEFGSVAPPALFGVAKRHFFGVARIPGIFRQTRLLNGGFVSEWRQGGTRQHSFSLVMPRSNELWSLKNTGANGYYGARPGGAKCL